MSAVSFDVKTILLEKLPELEFAVNLFIGREPDSPDEVATIFEYYGSSQMTLSNELCYSRDRIQIRVRSDNYISGSELAWKIQKALNRFTGKVNGIKYVLIKVTSNVAHLDWDESNRPRFVVSFECQREV